MELTKKERILVYKDGISNNAVKKYLNKYNYKYDDIVKENEYDYIVKPPGVLMNEIKVKGPSPLSARFTVKLSVILSLLI